MFYQQNKKMKKTFAVILLAGIFCCIGLIFWYTEWRYSLPTPVPEKYHAKENGERKLYCYDVGEDRYGNPFHPELSKMLQHMIEKHGLFIKAKE